MFLFQVQKSAQTWDLFHNALSFNEPEMAPKACSLAFHSSLIDFWPQWLPGPLVILGQVFSKADFVLLLWISKLILKIESLLMTIRNGVFTFFRCNIKIYIQIFNLKYMLIRDYFFNTLIISRSPLKKWQLVQILQMMCKMRFSAIFTLYI